MRSTGRGTRYVRRLPGQGGLLLLELAGDMALVVHPEGEDPPLRSCKQALGVRSDGLIDTTTRSACAPKRGL
jgi:hypothetical protein